MTISAQAIKFALNFIAAAVLARLLSPREFGLVGMVLGVTGLVGVFKELGLSTATVQRDKITQQQVSNLFWINVGFSGLLAVVSASLSPFVATFYHDVRVAGIMLVLSLTFLLTGSTVQHQALLIRQMRFQALAVIDVTSIGIGFASACLAAWLGYGYWALVAQQVMTAFSTLIMTWCTSGWRPQLPTTNSGVKPLVKFGAHLSLADFIGQISVNSDSVLLGRFFGAEPLGLYTRSNVLLARPIQQVITPLNSVLIPVLSRLQTDALRYRRSFMRAYDTLALIVFTFAAMCFVLSKPLVLVILGAKWTGVIPLFSAFTLVAISGPLASVCTWIYESQARGQDQLRNHVAAGVVTVVSYLAGLPWGPLGVIVSLSIISLFIRMPIVYYIAGREGPVRTRDLWKAFLSHLPCWGVVWITTSCAYKLVEQYAPITQVAVAAPIGLGLGLAVILLFRRPRESVLFAWTTARRALMARFVTS